VRGDPDKADNAYADGNPTETWRRTAAAIREEMHMAAAIA
jgi:hypothetical protein